MVKLCRSTTGHKNSLLIFSQSHWHVKILFISDIALELSMAALLIKGKCWKINPNHRFNYNDNNHTCQMDFCSCEFVCKRID